MDTVKILSVGSTFDLNGWRASRTSNAVRLVHLDNAGRTGKRCPHIEILASFGGEESLDGVVAQVTAALQHGGTVDAIHDSLVRTWGLEPALKVFRADLRGIDVPREVPFSVDANLVRGTFSEVSFLFTFSFYLSENKASGKHDTLIGNLSRRDAAKAFPWLKANKDRLPSMNIAQFRAEMSALGVRCA